VTLAGRALGSLFATALMMASAFAETREFEDTFGRVVSGELVSHKGMTAKKVKLKIKEKIHELPITKFCERDQKYIREWMAKTPPSINYAFRIEALKKKQSTVRMRNYYYNGGNKSDMYVFEVDVTNVCTQPVSNLKITYQAVLDVENPARLLRPGMTASVKIQTAAADAVLHVPNAALRFTPPGQSQQDDTFWVLRHDELVPLHVVTGISDGVITQIDDPHDDDGGIAEGDEVLVDLTPAGRALHEPHEGS